jgi:hypothetical protein
VARGPAARAGEQLAEREEAQGFASPSELGALVSAEKVEFLPAAPQLILRSRPERQVPQESLRAAAPGGQKKVSEAAVMPGFPAVQTLDRISAEAVAALLAGAEMMASVTPSQSAMAVTVGFQKPTEAVAPALVAQ